MSICKSKKKSVNEVKKFAYNLLLIIVCLAGLAKDQIIMVVSNDPLAINVEFGDHATLLTLALWKPHSLLCAG
jgi:hypothetical protein